VAEDGKTGWLKPDGTVLRFPPKHLGVIGNAHHIKFSSKPGESSPFDSCFESEYDAADNSFPDVISWLRSLDREYLPDQNLPERFIPHDFTAERLIALTECAVSLAVRSPRNREASVGIAERLRGPIPSPERETLTAYNMRSSQRIVSDKIGANGKYVAIFSNSKEFVYGDGFFHNVCGVIHPPVGAKIFAPITPEISVCIIYPRHFRVEPRLSTIVLSDEEIDLCNKAVQVYSRQAIFFRSEQPEIEEAYAREALDNRAEPRDNASVIAGGDWVHGRQAARIR
jgi:hypothetical protein